MSDELDDAFELEGRRRHAKPCGTVQTRPRPRVARLVSRVYGAAGAPLRARMLACLVRPLGSLGLMAVASGAFAGFLHRRSEGASGIPLDDLARYSNDQIFELVRFVEQVSPDAIEQVAGLLADSPVGVAAFGAAAAMLLVRTVRSFGPKRSRPLLPGSRQQEQHGRQLTPDERPCVASRIVDMKHSDRSAE